MQAALPLHTSLACEAQKSLVNQRRRLERVVLALATKVFCGAAPQFVVDQQQQLVLRWSATRRPCLKQPGHVCGWR
jgi:hypothetical protein